MKVQHSHKYVLKKVEVEIPEELEVAEAELHTENIQTERPLIIF